MLHSNGAHDEDRNSARRFAERVSQDRLCSFAGDQSRTLVFAYPEKCHLSRAARAFMEVAKKNQTSMYQEV
ncbi:hypothetical protein CHCC20441_1830 [Bacillus licheniformis]|uniref:Uncharacterized protein n=1 Tax=Bacillus licheniformis TaxID=1402 RepID=A0A8B5YHT4_BACLI|nr:hypothetical protein [Bacillus licheniformis]AKQ75113.1 hypothetical protein MUY_003981 [Bacillus licheniformis WX-02]KYC84853.1 hypothetical protein B4091_4184 [Bacillus licheniformis]KYD00406.1 hypothetical protein B4164_3927 [Bacillus licheniformis]OLG04354.1 hypothetical protein B4124_2274 [Bacillus licheniformis]TWJ42158.1 hypothetical protein CHCC5026_3522 [Bacillus licheniformis]